MRNQGFIFALLLGSLALWAPQLAAQSSMDGPSVENPLAPFQRLVGAQWHLGGSYQEFEWGVGGRSVRSRSYSVVGGEAQSVSEGSWFWHPGEKVLKGYFTAVEMPAEFFDYTTTFEGEKMVNDLRAYDAFGNQEAFVETWEFIDEDRYLWKLFQKTPDGLAEIMSGTYSRKIPRPSTH